MIEERNPRFKQHKRTVDVKTREEKRGRETKKRSYEPSR